MQNESCIRIKPVSIIIRKCHTISRIHEIVVTMRHPVVSFYNKGNYLKITAKALDGCCEYHYESFHYNPFSTSKSDIDLLNELWDISTKNKGTLNNGK